MDYSCYGISLADKISPEYLSSVESAAMPRLLWTSSLLWNPILTSSCEESFLLQRYAYDRTGKLEIRLTTKLLDWITNTSNCRIPKRSMYTSQRYSIIHPVALILLFLHSRFSSAGHTSEYIALEAYSRTLRSIPPAKNPTPPGKLLSGHIFLYECIYSSSHLSSIGHHWIKKKKKPSSNAHPTP